MLLRGGFRTAATSKMELFVIIVNSWKPVTIIRKCSILDVAAVLDPPLIWIWFHPQFFVLYFFIVKMQNICNLTGRNDVHISDILNFYSANIR